MKKLLFFTAVICVILIFGSCKKCIECTAYLRADNSILTQQKYCGRSSRTIDRNAEDFENTFTDSYTHAVCRDQ